MKMANYIGNAILGFLHEMLLRYLARKLLLMSFGFVESNIVLFPPIS